MEALKAGYIKGSEPYKKKEEQIQFDYDTNVVRARAKAAEKAQEAIESLKEWEIQGVQRIDMDSLQKLKSLENIPLTTQELKVILAKHGRTNYWAQRYIGGVLCENNGVPQSDLGIEAPLDVKLNVLDGLSNQLEDMLEHFTLDPNRSDRKSMEARWLYLNDDILQNAINIYNNSLTDISEADAATKAFYKIKATSGQMQKGVMIANVMRNLKKEDAKNNFLCCLSQEPDISSAAYEVAGISDVMAEWKHGKAERYTKAIQLADELKTVNDTEKIKSKLRAHLDRVDKGLEQENEFLQRELKKTYKKNSSIKKALSEMSDTERTTLMNSGTEPEQSAGETE